MSAGPQPRGIAIELDDSAEACPYLAGRSSTFRNYVMFEVNEAGFVELLRTGHRHFAEYFYRPRCITSERTGGGFCGRCVPVRVDVARFVPSRGQRRVLRRGSQVEMICSVPHYEPWKYEMYRRHKERFPPLPSGATDAGAQSEALFERSMYGRFPFTRECVYRLAGEPIAVSLLDIAGPLASSIYCFFDPRYSELSPGTLSILLELRHARQLGLAEYHLGYLIAENRSMRYKADFRPSEYFDGAEWRPLRGADGGWRAELDSIRMAPGTAPLSAGFETLRLDETR